MANFSINVNLDNNTYRIENSTKYFISLFYNIQKKSDLSFYIPAATIKLGKVIYLSSIKKASLKVIKTIYNWRKFFSNNSLFNSCNVRQQNCCLRL